MVPTIGRTFTVRPGRASTRGFPAWTYEARAAALEGAFIFIYVWAISLTSCFIYRCENPSDESYVSQSGEFILIFIWAISMTSCFV